MYQTSPMENYNKNNPFIVVSKKKYDTIVDDIHLFGKSCIKWNIILIICWIINVAISVFYIVYNKDYLHCLSIIILLAIGIIISILLFRRDIKYFMISHPKMKEFDRISALEVNDILALNNEDVLKCLHGLYELHGELNATIKFYKILYDFYLAFEIVVFLRFII